MLAAWLTAGQEVVLVDREAPAKGSTTASTAMLLWELDTSFKGERHPTSDYFAIDRA